jgi:hypothetical protein
MIVQAAGQPHACSPCCVALRPCACSAGGCAAPSGAPRPWLLSLKSSLTTNLPPYTQALSDDHAGPGRRAAGARAAAAPTGPPSEAEARGWGRLASLAHHPPAEAGAGRNFRRVSWLKQLTQAADTGCGRAPGKVPAQPTRQVLHRLRCWRCLRAHQRAALLPARQCLPCPASKAWRSSAERALHTASLVARTLARDTC